MQIEHTAEWVLKKLGEYFTIKHGYAFKGKNFSDSGHYIVVTPGNFYDEGGFKRVQGKEKYYLGDFDSSYFLKRDDLIIAMTEQAEGLLGSSAMIPQDDLYLHNQRIGLVENLDETQLNKTFLYYLFNTKLVRQQIRATASGLKVRHTAPSRIYEIEFLKPGIETQIKTAAILSAYDNLIENNLRRIRILEEMAQLIYREWFVKFRFRDHEKVKMVDSPLGEIPEGWKVVNLSDIADVNIRSIRKGNAPEYIHYIDISSVLTGSIDKIDSLLFAEAPSRARRIVQHGDVIWSTVRPNRKSYCLILNPLPRTIVSTGFAVLTAKHVPHVYLYHAVTTDEFTQYLVNNTTGAAYPAVNTKDFENASVVQPSKRVLDAFDNCIAQMYLLKSNLEAKNRILRQTRDLLLPKLISGQLDVSELDIDIREPVT